MVTGTIVGLELDRDTAAHYVERIKEHLIRADYHVNQARKLILDLRERGGWRALNYKSWTDCVQNEFGKSSSAVYRQLNAALVELELSPNGQLDMSERALRPLTKRGYSTEAKQAIYAVCQELVGQGGKVTTGVVEAVVDGFKDMLQSGATQDADGNQTPISERMEADLLARVRQKKIAHKEHITHMDKKRDYLLGAVKISNVKTNDYLKNIRVDAWKIDDINLARIEEAKRLGKPIYVSMWTEE